MIPAEFDFGDEDDAWSGFMLEGRRRERRAFMDNGKRRQFASGAVRDTTDGKPRPDLISPLALLRVGEWMARGVDHYGERNWEKGIPFSVCYASLLRHVLKFAAGRTDEDHLAAVVFNAQAMMHYQEAGMAELDDMPHYQDGPCEE